MRTAPKSTDTPDEAQQEAPCDNNAAPNAEIGSTDPYGLVRSVEIRVAAAQGATEPAIRDMTL